MKDKNGKTSKGIAKPLDTLDGNLSETISHDLPQKVRD